MLKFPKHIQEALMKSAKYHEKAKINQRIFEEWIEEKYGEEIIMHDGIRDTLIDLVEQSNNPRQAIEKISNLIQELTKTS